MIEVTLLGTGSPIPDARRAGPSTLVRAGGQTFVVDCGRGVQQRMTEWYGEVKGDIVTVAHGGTARALMVALGFETPQSAADLPIAQGAVYVFSDGGLKKY